MIYKHGGQLCDRNSQTLPQITTRLALLLLGRRCIGSRPGHGSLEGILYSLFGQGGYSAIVLPIFKRILQSDSLRLLSFTFGHGSCQGKDVQIGIGENDVTALEVSVSKSCSRPQGRGHTAKNSKNMRYWPSLNSNSRTRSVPTCLTAVNRLVLRNFRSRATNMDGAAAVVRANFVK